MLGKNDSHTLYVTFRSRDFLGEKRNQLFEKMISFLLKKFILFSDDETFGKLEFLHFFPKFQKQQVAYVADKKERFQEIFEQFVRKDLVFGTEGYKNE